MRYANIAIAARVFHPFTYLVPADMQLEPGMRVQVPFHRRKALGYVIESDAALPSTVKPASIKPIDAILDEKPVFSCNLIKLISWMSQYYCAPIGEVCKTALPNRLNKLKNSELKRNIAAPFEIENANNDLAKLTLTAEQTQALQKILANYQQENPKPILLKGITGSGKTEIYLNLCAKALAENGQVILLVPEIGLTPQLAERVLARFGEQVAIYHSGLTEAQRYQQWQNMKSGKASIAVGTRSALFAPFDNVRAIIIDEEHDTSYKQEEGLLYQARDTAVMRAYLDKALIVLGSATPSFESYANAKKGKYDIILLRERATGASLPSVEIVDLRKKSAENSFEGRVALSKKLADAIGENLERKEQSILFLNRRGFAHFLLCESCGHVYECSNCNISLTHHARKNKLICHYCDFHVGMPSKCVECQSSELTPMGQGTERLEAELEDFFPTARIARLDRDSITKKNIRSKIFKQMRAGKIDILVGTQLITKGHDFPGVTLVGIISADASLHIPDFRAGERTFQLITQVAGRAGRAQQAGRVIVQTYQPEHHSILHAQKHDFVGFYTEEHEARAELSYPPFARLANVRFTGNNAASVQSAAEFVAKYLELNLSADMSLLGPAPAPLEKIRGKFRWQMLLKTPSAQSLAKFMQNVQQNVEKQLPSGVRMTIDIDPIKLC